MGPVSASRAATHPRRIFVILNPAANQGRGCEREREIRQGFAGHEVHMESTARAGHAGELATQAAAQGYDVIVIAGGDGTIHEALSGLLRASADRTTPVVGIIPIGTGNDLAFTLGMRPNDVAAACQRILQGKPMLMDAGRIVDEQGTTSYFFNSTGAGFDAAVAIETKSLKLKGFAFYLVALLRTMAKKKRDPIMTVIYGERRVTKRLLMAGVTNGRRAGGGFLLTPDAQLNDGLLDVCLVQELGRVGILRLTPHFMNGSHVRQPTVTMGRAASVLIESPDPLPVYADGEVLRSDAHRLEFTVLPATIPILVDRAAE